MQGRPYAYQYETSPRKIKQDYNTQKKRQSPHNRPIAKKKSSNKRASTSKKESKKSTQKVDNTSSLQSDDKNTKKEIGKAKFSIAVKTVLMLLMFFAIIFRTSKINEQFAKIQALKNQIAVIQKENDQLEINIQNSINLQSIEQAAKERLGMQRLTDKQTVQISLPKKDYTEPSSEKVIINQDENIFEKVINAIKDLF